MHRIACLFRNNSYGSHKEITHLFGAVFTLHLRVFVLLSLVCRVKVAGSLLILVPKDLEEEGAV